MMVKPFSLQRLLELSQMRMDEAGRRLHQLAASEKEADARLTLLQDYRAEYQKRFLAAASSGMGGNALNNYRSFIARLDEAIRQAQAAVDQAKVRTAAGKQDWLDKRLHLKAYDTLSARHFSREQTIEQRQEQKVQDEHAAHKHQFGKAEEQ